MLSKWAACLFGLASMMQGHYSLANPPTAEDVFALLGVDKPQINELAQGKLIAVSLPQGSADELAAGVVLYLPAPLAKITARLQPNDITVDADVTAYAVLSNRSGMNEFGRLSVSAEEVEALLESKPGYALNLSAQEIEGFHALKRSAEADKHYREILFRRLEAYRHGGLAAIAGYARDDTLDSSPAVELRQAANESKLLTRYFPALAQAWTNYPAAWPAGVEEQWMWVRKTVEKQPTTILRHVVSSRWSTGLIMLTREIYVEHSYNSSQWISLCLAYRNGTLIVQKVRSFSDQVTGLGSDVKHLIGDEILKNKMLATWERFRDAAMEKP